VRVIAAPTAATSHQSFAASVAAADDVPALKRCFERDHHVLIPGLMRGPPLDRVRRELDRGEFEERRHTTGHVELCMDRGRARTLLFFLCNDLALFELVRGITGCDRIGAFVGRVYRMLPGADHEGTWHDDLAEGRMVAMSVNLGHAPYSGGVLEIRDHESKEILQRVANTGFGDAVIFRIARQLQHRVTAVDGAVPKTAFAGWFLSGPDSELIHPGDFLASDAVKEELRAG
jgi:2OG-Fe(II) oxygenase superfamily